MAARNLSFGLGDQALALEGGPVFQVLRLQAGLGLLLLPGAGQDFLAPSLLCGHQPLGLLPGLADELFGFLSPLPQDCLAEEFHLVI